jgi:hypothetical protein
LYIQESAVLKWIWDPEKAAANFLKHGVSFDLAERVFGDPLAMTFPDPFAHEDRWRTIGRPSAESLVTLLVVHTWPDDDTDQIARIISARRATAHERKAYEEG